MDRNIYRQYICDPVVRFKFATMWLKMIEGIGIVKWVPIAMDKIESIDNLQCQYSRNHNKQSDIFYLLIDKVVIRSDMFGGLTKTAKIHFHFDNLYVCKQFVKTVKNYYIMTKKIQPTFTIYEFIKLLCDKKIKATNETNEIARILMDEILPIIRKQRPGVTFVSQYIGKLDWIAGGTPEQACNSLTSWLYRLT